MTASKRRARRGRARACPARRTAARRASPRAACEQVRAVVDPGHLPAERRELARRGGPVPQARSSSAAAAAAPQQRRRRSAPRPRRACRRRRGRSSRRGAPGRCSGTVMPGAASARIRSTTVRDLLVGQRDRRTAGRARVSQRPLGDRAVDRRGSPAARCRNGCRFIGQKNVRDSIPSSRERRHQLVAAERELVVDDDRVHPVDVARPVAARPGSGCRATSASSAL